MIPFHFPGVFRRWAPGIWVALCVVCAWPTALVRAQSPVAVRSGLESIEAAPGARVSVRLHLTIEAPYHIYGTTTAVGPRGLGPTATSVTLLPNPVATPGGALTTSPAEKRFDPNFDVEVVTLEGQPWIDFPLQVKADAKPGRYPLVLSLGFQACTEESCLPPEDIPVPVVLTVLAGGAAAPRAPREAADPFAEFQTVASAPLTLMNDRAWYERTGPAEREALMAASAELIVALGEKILADHPADVRRWPVVAAMLRTKRKFSGEGAETRRAAWWARRDVLREQLVAAPDAPDGLAASVLELAVYAGLGGRWAEPDAQPDEAAAVRAADRMRARVPGSDRRKFAEQHLIEHWIERKEWEKSAQRLRVLGGESAVNAPVATMAEGLLRKLALRETPLEMSFVALDGTRFDLASLRGKVVLIDFWATWCAPCMEEMPEIKRVYAAYRSQGFEIVGISFDSLPRDPAQPRSQERTAEQVRAFLRQEGMTWPQYFDGKGWDNRWGRTFSSPSCPPPSCSIDRAGWRIWTTMAQTSKRTYAACSVSEFFRAVRPPELLFPWPLSHPVLVPCDGSSRFS